MQKFSKVKYATSNWWLFFPIGLSIVTLALFLILQPIVNFKVLNLFYSLCFFISGISGLVYIIIFGHWLSEWCLYAFSAIIDLLLGIILGLNPVFSTKTLPYFVATLLVTKAIFAIINSMDLKKWGIKNWRFELLIAFFAILLAIVILFNPNLNSFNFSSWVIVAVISSFFTVLIFYGGLRKLKKIIAINILEHALIL